MLKDRVIYLFLNEIGYAKTNIALKVLEELGLVSLNKNGLLTGIVSKEKTDLLNSNTFRTLNERGGNDD